MHQLIQRVVDTKLATYRACDLFLTNMPYREAERLHDEAVLASRAAFEAATTHTNGLPYAEASAFLDELQKQLATVHNACFAR